MTGPELVLGGKLLDAAGKEISAASAEGRKAVLEAAKDTPGMRRAGMLRGQRMAVQQEIVLKVWRPLGWLFGVSKDYFETDFNRELTEKLADVSEEDLVTPKPSIVGPAVQGLGYSLDEPNLKDMYLNLLAAASTASRAEDVHPSFVEVIRQLSSAECSHLNGILARVRVPCVRIKRDHTTGSYTSIHEYLLDYSFANVAMPAENPPKLHAWINNWQQLGLVSAGYESWLGSSTPDAPDVYGWVERRPELVQARKDLPVVPEGQPGPRISYDKGMVEATPRGLEFYAAVGSPAP